MRSSSCLRGASSNTRRNLGIGLADWGFDQYWLVVDLMLDGDAGLPPVIQQVCDAIGQRLMCLPPMAITVGSFGSWMVRATKSTKTIEECANYFDRGFPMMPGKSFDPPPTGSTQSWLKGGGMAVSF
ncbi:MAG: hypothetical protein Ct9H300mP12_08360 [Acidimicrobiales bacterium]|nr:MAG: hypothetical protein Ct9H300mP12_08360 [Acidimicrobiales bacterium]